MSTEFQYCCHYLLDEVESKAWLGLVFGVSDEQQHVSPGESKAAAKSKSPKSANFSRVFWDSSRFIMSRKLHKHVPPAVHYVQCSPFAVCPFLSVKIDQACN